VAGQTADDPLYLADRPFPYQAPVFFIPVGNDDTIDGDDEAKLAYDVQSRQLLIDASHRRTPRDGAAAHRSAS